MRGKHASAAAGRRDRADLEQRAALAEHLGNRLQQELAAQRSESTRRITALQEQVRLAIAERDEVTSPAMRELRERHDRVRAERDHLRPLAQTYSRKYGALINNIAAWLREEGMADAQVLRVMEKAQVHLKKDLFGLSVHAEKLRRKTSS